MSSRMLSKTLACTAFCSLALFTFRAGAGDGAPLTFDQVAQFLDLDVKEDRLIKMVSQSSTTFTLGANQVQFLKAKGASDALLEAMQKKAAPAGQLPADTSDIADFVLILDCSGSMQDSTADGKTKWAVAQQAALDLVTAIPSGRQLAFIVYGHDVHRGCGAVDLLKPLSPLSDRSRAALVSQIMQLTPQGHTPIARSLNMAAAELQNSTSLSKVILITDGVETCHADPVEAAARLAANEKLKGGLTVIGFGLKQNEAASVALIAKAGKGEYHDARNAAELVKTVKAVGQSLSVTKPPVKSNAVKSEVLPSKDPNAPARVELEKYIAGRISDKDHYFSFDVSEAAGEYVLLCDIKRADDADKNLMFSLYVDEREVAHINQIDRDNRLAARVKLQPGRHGFRLHNDVPGAATEICDYKFAIYRADSQIPFARLDYVHAIQPIKVGQNVTFTLNPKSLGSVDEFFTVTLPAGDYLAEMEFATTDEYRNPRSYGNYGATAMVVSDLGVEQQDLLHEYGSGDKPLSSRKKLILADDTTLLLQVRAANERSLKVRLRFTPWSDEAR